MFLFLKHLPVTGYVFKFFGEYIQHTLYCERNLVPRKIKSKFPIPKWSSDFRHHNFGQMIDIWNAKIP